mmetsp:Transcript_28769/g.66346  ORF Transcript_28769/g.66346 Transcript_28769/m.66346 type:complete len:240 (+) Transcript_28769:34-753(+)
MASQGNSGDGERKLKVLGLHGGGSNTNIMQFQTQALQRAIGKDVEWDFMNGERPWQSPIHHPVLVTLAKDMPFYGWYGVVVDDDSDRPYEEKLFDLSVRITYEDVELAVERVMNHITENGPFDALVGFSQGCIVIHLVTAILRQRGEEIPWKLSILFCGMRVRDQRYIDLFTTPMQHPAIMVFGKQDEFYEYGKTSQMEMYEAPMVLEHDEGHKFPSARPRAKEIYDAIAEELRRCCAS